MTTTRLRWGIEMRWLHPVRWSGPLAVTWMHPKVTAAYTDNWPAIFPTRREARGMAEHLIAHHARHAWRFRACRVTITVTA
jgi:hypothetical protein